MDEARTDTTRSRRAVIAGAVAGALGLAASAVVRPEAASANDGDSLVTGVGPDLGGRNSSFNTTKWVSYGDANVLRIERIASGAAPAMIIDQAASQGQPAIQALGTGANAIGVEAYLSGTGSTFGVQGIVDSPAGRGVYGEGPGWGVEGIATGSATGVGVHGKSGSADPTGIGVLGESPALGGATRGLLGKVTSAAGTGCFAQNLGSSTWAYLGGPQVGAYGETPTAAGSGVEGAGTHLSGGVFGVYGHVVSPAGIGVIGANFASSGAAVGVKGQTSSPTGIGVAGSAPAGSAENYGVYGVTGSSSGRGVFGRALAAGGGAGVVGQGDGPTAIGVRGVAWDGTTLGSYGTAVMGVAGMHDKATWPAGRANTGVMGVSPTGTGALGTTTTGTGVSASASGSTGFALRTSGRVNFGKVSGVATIAAGGTASAPIATGTDITASSYVLLTPQGDPGTHRIWATLDTTANTVTIRTNAAFAAAFRVAWLVLG